MPNQEQDTPVFNVGKTGTRRESNRALPFHTTYDDNGNMTSRAEAAGDLTFEWDYENRLTGALQGEGGLSRVYYSYDALGRRVKTVTPLNATTLTYDGLDVVMEENESRIFTPIGGGVITKYQNGLGIDNKLEMATDGTAKYFLQDHLGSTIGLTDASGNITESASYDSFGNSTNNLSTRYQYTGREKDDFTGLYYYRARWYDANLGRFISEDPIGFAGGDVNQFGYIGNNPLSGTDSTGLTPESDQRLEIAQQDLLQALEPAFQFGIGFGDNVLFGLSKYARSSTGVDECSAAYQAGEWASIAMQAAEGGVGIYRAGTKLFGKYAARSVLREAEELAVPCLRCFEADTEVQTEQGLKPIEKIETGDKVLSYNEQTRLLEYQDVLAKFTRYADDIYSVSVEGESQPLGVTSEHPFFVRVYRARDGLTSNDDDDGEWRETQNLQVGDEIKLASGNWAKVLEVKFKGAGQVYNFTVAGNHNYFVGNSRLLTHNIECTDLAYGLQKKLGGGSVYHLEPKAGNYLNVPNKLYPGKGMWDYHDVLIKDRMVYDPLSRFGNSPIPFQQWWRAWEQGSVTSIRKL